MYSEKLAIAIKSNGKVLREFGDTVKLPFGSEYSIFVKNLNSVRALVKIEIDGKDIADGTSFIVPANGSIDIERFLRNGNKDVGNRFKFIERTERVEKHRGGPQIEDGLIRIEYEFEREPAPLINYTPWYQPLWNQTPPTYYGTSVNYTTTDSIIGGGSASAQSTPLRCSNDAAVKSSGDDWIRCQSVNDAGITAPGSVSEQKFVEGYIGALDGVKHVMVMRLIGEVGNVKITRPITVKSKPRCSSCGHLNRSIAKFCTECGTGLELI